MNALADRQNEAVTCDLLVRDAAVLATVDARARELPGGWVAVTGGVISGVGDAATPPPPARRAVSAAGALVTPGLVNVHHHIFQNLTRAWIPLSGVTFLGWAEAAMRRWSLLDAEAVRLSSWIGAAELVLSGCTTSSDMMYAHVRPGTDLFGVTVEATREVGLRFHPVRACVTVGAGSGGIHAPAMVEDAKAAIAACEDAIAAYHDPAPGAMVRVALGPSMLVSMALPESRRLAELAEEHDLRLHTHIAEDPGGAAFAREQFGMTELERLAAVGMLGPRTWLAHGILLTDAEIARLAEGGVSVAHCPASNAILGAGIAPAAALRAAGIAVGLGVDGSSSSDSASVAAEARLALLVGKLRDGPESVDARTVLRMATRGGAACLGREGELGQLAVGCAADIAVWPMGDSPATAGAADLVEAWVRCAPVTPSHVIVNGQVIVADGRLQDDRLPAMLRGHAAAARRIRGEEQPVG
jgi:cytosine/adenosine deaminase-related metal-dependent hydrolase